MINTRNTVVAGAVFLSLFVFGAHVRMLLLANRSQPDCVLAAKVERYQDTVVSDPFGSGQENQQQSDATPRSASFRAAKRSC